MMPKQPKQIRPTFLRMILLLLVPFFFWNNCTKTPMKSTEKNSFHIIPRPAKLKPGKGSFALSASTSVVFDGQNAALAAVANYLVTKIRDNTGTELPIVPDGASQPTSAIFLRLHKDDKLGAEGYTLAVRENAVVIEANQAAGLFYGVQTLFQLLPPEIFAQEKIFTLPLTIPGVRIWDRPRYSWRGMMLDVSRHFLPKEFVLRFIDYLAMHKMNVFHWHLTDDQGWRIEIEKYPKLTEIGAWRMDRSGQYWSFRDPQREGEIPNYGGFYTQADIREVVAYAQSRFITIVPEIEMPGHCTAALAAYPELSCTGGPFTVPTGGVWPIKDVYCPGNDTTFAFLQDILTEVMALFPGVYVHIGGDEVDKTEWLRCSKCQERMRTEDLADTNALQSYFIHRIEQFLNAHQRNLIGWDEILEGGLAPNATVMSWRGTEGGIAAANAGHDVVMSPTSHCYFDYYQGNPATEPPAIGGLLPLQTVYEFEPTPGAIASKAKHHILGAQANLWTEYIPDPAQAEYMTFPRIAALAEVVWSDKKLRNWPDFRTRLATQFKRYNRAGINFAKSANSVRIEPVLDQRLGELVINLNTETVQPTIRFTLDGTSPGPQSSPYLEPIRLSQTTVLRAAAFSDSTLVSPVSETRFIRHLAIGRVPGLRHRYQEKYAGGGEIGLTNGLRGSKFYLDGVWQGFEGDDLIADIDLGQNRPIQGISVGFLQNTGVWIFLPSEVNFSLSANGSDFYQAASVIGDSTLRSPDIVIKDFSCRLSGQEARWIRVHAKSLGICPDWHPGAGGKAWLFADEIIVE